MKKQILRLGKNSMIYGVGKVLTRFINLLLLPLFTAYLTPSDYGVLALLALLSFVAHPVFSLGLSAAMGPSYFQGNNAQQKSRTIWTSFLILLGSVTILIIIAWLFPHQLSMIALQSPEYGHLVSLTLTGCGINILSTPFTHRIQFEERAQAFVLITLIAALISIALSVIAVVLLGWGVKGMVISQLLGHAIHFLIFFIAGARETIFCYSKPIARELLRLGIPLVPSFAFLFILLQSNRYILQWFEGLEQVGIYSVGFNIGMVMAVAVSAVSTAWYPFFMSYMEKQNEAEVLFGRIFTYYVYLFGTLCMLFFIGAKLVVLIMTQPDFHGAYVVVGFAASAQFFMGVFNMFLPGMYYTKEVRYVALVQGLAAFVSVMINIVMIRWAGLFGAAIALSLGQLLMAVFQYLWNIYRKENYVKIKYEWSRIASFSVLFMFVAVATLIGRELTIFMEAFYTLFLTATIFTVIFFMLKKNERGFIMQQLLFLKSHKASPVRYND